MIDEKSQLCYGFMSHFCKELLVEKENYWISYNRQKTTLVADTLARASKLYASPKIFDMSQSSSTNILSLEMK